jgi:hypothetical protein
VPLDGQSSRWLDLATLQPAGPAVVLQFPVALTPAGLLGLAPGGGLVLAQPDGEPAQHAGAPPVRMAAVSRDGRATAALDQAGDLRAGGAVVRSGLQRYFIMQLDAAGRRLWITATNRELLCLSWPDGRELWKQTLPAIAPHFLLLPGENQLIVALETGTLEVRDAGTGALVRSLDSGSAAPQALALTPDGTRLFVGGLEGEIHCFAPADWRYLHALPLGASERLHVLVCSPDGRTLAALTKTGMLHVVRTQ